MIFEAFHAHKKVIKVLESISDHLTSDTFTLDFIPINSITVLKNKLDVAIKKIITNSVLLKPQVII